MRNQTGCEVCDANPPWSVPQHIKEIVALHNLYYRLPEEEKRLFEYWNDNVLDNYLKIPNLYTVRSC